MVQDVVARYHEALAAQDFDGARKLLRDDLRFAGPFESFLDTAPFAFLRGGR